ncbi:hypothetical protein [Sorangium sp. So ce117]|uniref:hypothetical protein n=1 Tax=Sorangium sp. So ce117 TaxID=3133277 RepID=UPI003F62E4EF
MQCVDELQHVDPLERLGRSWRAVDHACGQFLMPCLALDEAPVIARHTAEYREQPRLHARALLELEEPPVDDEADVLKGVDASRLAHAEPAQAAPHEVRVLVAHHVKVEQDARVVGAGAWIENEPRKGKRRCRGRPRHTQAMAGALWPRHVSRSSTLVGGRSVAARIRWTA